MSDSHTAGKLRIVGDDEHAGGIPFIEIASGECPSPSFKSVCAVCCTMPDEGDFFLSDEDRANARRIVAAWNALAGVPTEQLEQAAANFDLIAMRQAETRAAEAERLLSEVMQWIENWDPNFIYDDEWPETQNAIRAFLDGSKP